MAPADDALSRAMAVIARGSGASSDFDLDPERRPQDGWQLRAAGVLLPVLMRGSEARLILTKRSSRLKHHLGQIAFPGGKVEQSDRDATAGALREAWEEIGLMPDNVEVLGQLSQHETVTNFLITPVLGRVLGPFVPRPEAGEVTEIFEVPLHHVTNPAHFIRERRRSRGVWRHYETVPYGPYYIWGATARILRRLADRMAQ